MHAGVGASSSDAPDSVTGREPVLTRTCPLCSVVGPVIALVGVASTNRKCLRAQKDEAGDDGFDLSDQQTEKSNAAIDEEKTEHVLYLMTTVTHVGQAAILCVHPRTRSKGG